MQAITHELYVADTVDHLLNSHTSTPIFFIKEILFCSLSSEGLFLRGAMSHSFSRERILIGLSQSGGGFPGDWFKSQHTIQFWPMRHRTAHGVSRRDSSFLKKELKRKLLLFFPCLMIKLSAYDARKYGNCFRRQPVWEDKTIC